MLNYSISSGRSVFSGQLSRVRQLVVHYLKWKKLADSVCDDFIGSMAAPPSRNDPFLLDLVQSSQAREDMQ